MIKLAIANNYLSCHDNLNVDKVLAAAEARKTYKPKIRIILLEAIEEATKVTNIVVAKKVNEAVIYQDKSEELKPSLIWDLDNQERDLRIHRAKQSNMYLPMIEAGASTLLVRSDPTTFRYKLHSLKFLFVR